MDILLHLHGYLKVFGTVTQCVSMCLWILCSTRCLSSGRRWCGKSFTSSYCENAPPSPSAAGSSFTDRRFHIPHALWVKKSLHHFCSLTGTELSEVYPSPDLVCGGLLATLFVRLCLLRALDC